MLTHKWDPFPGRASAVTCLSDMVQGRCSGALALFSTSIPEAGGPPRRACLPLIVTGLLMPSLEAHTQWEGIPAPPGNPSGYTEKTCVNSGFQPSFSKLHKGLSYILICLGAREEFAWEEFQGRVRMREVEAGTTCHSLPSLSKASDLETTAG